MLQTHKVTTVGMISGHHGIVLITALLSGSVFALIFNAGLDFILMFLATIPLLATGMGREPKMAFKAGIIASPVVLLLTASSFSALLFFFVFALPSWYISATSARHCDLKMESDMGTLRLWYPMGFITVHLAVYACVLLAAATAFFAIIEDTNLPQYIIQIIKNEISSLGEEYGIDENRVYASPQTMSFILVGALAWLWKILLLTCAWLVNNALLKKNMARRVSLAIFPFPLPHWLLTLIGICALGSIIGGESMRFLGRSSLFILLFPYFVQGAAMIHLNTLAWPNRRIFLFFVYFVTILSFWPALLVAGIGLWHHAKILNKYLSSGGNSSKS